MEAAARVFVINYHVIVSQNEKEIVEFWENEVRRQRRVVPDSKIEEEVDWIINTEKSGPQTTMYHKT